jgi:hypothetical protein
MADNQIDYERVRRIIRRELRQEQRKARIALFVGNLMIAVFFSLVAWVTGISAVGSGSVEPGWPVWLVLILLTIGLLMGLLLHGFAAFGNLTGGAIRDRVTRRAMQEETLRAGLNSIGGQAKLKYTESLQLSDDGELVPDDAESVHSQKSSRG